MKVEMKFSCYCSIGQLYLFFHHDKLQTNFIFHFTRVIFYRIMFIRHLIIGLPNNSYKPITNTACIRARLCTLQKRVHYSQPQVIKFTSCLPMVGVSLRVLRLLPSLKLVAMILLKVALNT